MAAAGTGGDNPLNKHLVEPLADFSKKGVQFLEKVRERRGGRRGAPACAAPALALPGVDCAAPASAWYHADVPPSLRSATSPRLLVRGVHCRGLVFARRQAQVPAHVPFDPHACRLPNLRRAAAHGD